LTRTFGISHGGELFCRRRDHVTDTSFDIAPKSTIERLVTEIYVVKNAVNPKYRAVDPQSLALIFIVLAVGSLHNLELAPNDPSAEEYLSLSKRCLAKSDFLTRSNIAGIQALVRPSLGCALEINDTAHHGSLPSVRPRMLQVLI
jgi:hypothetical protein